MENRRPLIVDVKRNALDDGPGIRTTIFFKGCSLACVWCQNPESLSPDPEIMTSAKNCLGCGACADACPRSAIDPGRTERVDRSLCRVCGTCAQVCPTGSLEVIGKAYEPAELAELVLKDKIFYENSGGGLTLSGGEAALFAEYLGRFLPLVKGEGVHVLLETAGLFNWKPFEKHVLPRLDTIYFDLKLADPSLHERFTGRSNKVILANLDRILARKRRPALLARVPLAPGVTAAPENLSDLSRILADRGIDRVALLPYNPLWVEKLARLGRSASYRREEWMSPEEEKACREPFEALGIKCVASLD